MICDSLDPRNFDVIFCSLERYLLAAPDMVETMVGTISRKRGADEAFDTRSIWCKMILSNLDAPPRTDTIRVCRMPEAAPFDSQALANEYIFNV